MVALIATSGSVAAFAASGKQGYISPKAILPGAITSGHIKDNDIRDKDIGSGAVKTGEIADGEVKNADIANNALTNAKMADNAVKSAEIDNDTIDDKDLGDAAIPSVVLYKPGKIGPLSNTWKEDFNESITTERKTAFVFNYAANLTRISSGNALLAKACVVDKDENIAYEAEPSPVSLSSTINVQRTVTFTNSSVSKGNYYVTVSVKTVKSDGTYITDRVFTVIALPTA